MKAIYLLSLLLLISSCSVHQDNRVKLTHIKELLSRDDSSVVDVIKSIDIKDLEFTKDKAVYALLWNYIAYRDFGLTYNDTLMSVANNYFSGSKFKMGEFYSHLLSGDLYVDLKDYERAEYFYKEAKKVTSLEGRKEERYASLLFDYAYLLFIQKKYEDAVHYNLEAFKICRLLEQKGVLKDRSKIVVSLRRAAGALSLDGRDSLSTHYYNQALDIAYNLKDSSEIVRTLRGLGIHYYKMRDIEKTSSVYDIILSEYIGFLEPKRDYGMFHIISSFYSQKVDSAKSRRFEELAFNAVENDLLAKRDLYKLFYEEEYKAQEYILAYDDLLNYSNCVDSLNVKKIRLLKLKEEERIAILLKDKDREAIILYLIFMPLLLISVIAICFSRILRLKERQRRLQSDATNVNVQLRDKLQSNIKREELAKIRGLFEGQIIATKIITGIIYSYESSPTLAVKKLREFLSIKNRENIMFDELREFINGLFNGIIDYIIEQYPELNSKDIDLCVLICADFTIQEISTIYGFSNINNVYVMKFRLKSKFNLKNGKNIDVFLKDLIKKRKKERDILQD